MGLTRIWQGDSNRLPLGVVPATCRSGDKHFLCFPRLHRMNPLGSSDLLPHNAASEPSTCLSDSWSEVRQETQSQNSSSVWLSRIPELPKQAGVDKKKISPVWYPNLSMWLATTRWGQNSQLHLVLNRPNVQISCTIKPSSVGSNFQPNSIPLFLGTQQNGTDQAVQQVGRWAQLVHLR